MSSQRDYRPTSAQLTDLAVYIVPPELWRESLHSAQSEIINDTISAGFIRVDPETYVSALREEINVQLEDESFIPQEYVFLKNVGRRLTKVRHKQENQLKVKNFMVPQTFVPEIFLLEAGSDTQSLHPSSVSSYRGEKPEDTSRADSYRGKGSFAKQKPVPPIQTGNGSNRQNGYDHLDNRTPPPMSATPTHGLSPLPPPPGQRHGRDDDDEDDGYLPPLSATPPPLSPGAYVKPRMTANKYSGNSNADSGISDVHDKNRWEDREDSSLRRQRLHDEQERKRRQEEERRRREEEERRRREEEERRRREDEERRRREEEERRRREEEERRKRENDLRRDEDDERKRREEEERRRREEEERRRREEEERRRRREQEEEDERLRREEEERLRREEELRLEEQRRKGDKESEKQTLIDELERLKQERQATEKQREELVRRAKQLQSKTQNRRNQARDVWKKKYFEEKKKTPSLEEQCTKLRQELDSVHRRIVSTMEGSKEKDAKRGPPDKPSQQSNVKIQATRLQHEIEDLQRRVETVKMKLTGEMKLRNQAETELRALKAELTQKKINVSLSRRQRNDHTDLYTPRSQPVSTRT